MSIADNRAARKWTRSELIGRLLWAICGPLFRWSPRICWGWRRNLLRLFGARVGAHVHIDPSAQITIPWNLEIADWSSIGFQALIYNLGQVKIGERTTISQRSHLCAGTHDHTDLTLPLIKAPITIGNDVWVCADAFVGPSVVIFDGAVVAARAVAVRPVAEWTVVAGNPAREVGKRCPKE